jgi:hypothetical protein
MASNEEEPPAAPLPQTDGPSTPPLLAGKRAHSDDALSKTRAQSEGPDSQALHSALRGLQQDKAHSGSPSRKRQRVYGDR